MVLFIILIYKSPQITLTLIKTNIFEKFQFKKRFSSFVLLYMKKRVFQKLHYTNSQINISLYCVELPQLDTICFTSV